MGGLGGCPPDIIAYFKKACRFSLKSFASLALCQHVAEELKILNRGKGLIVPFVYKSLWSSKPFLVHSILQ